MQMFGSLTKLFGARDRRKHKRFAASPGAFVVIGPKVKDKRRIQVLDISMGGLAFIYDGSAKDLKESGMLSLLAEEKVYVDNVHYDTVADYPLPTNPQKERDLRKKGVRFTWLGFLDKQDLEEFIHIASIGEV